MENREKAFQRNTKLETLLKELNSDLDIAENLLLQKEYETYPIVLVMGALRSGTTLTMQWLANTGQFAYPTNMLSRFYNAPILGAKIQNLLLNPEYSFRNEICDFSRDVQYVSQNGKTQGAMAPNEFWYFWRRFFPYAELEQDYMSKKELESIFERQKFISELMGICNVLQKPLAMKGMIVNYNIDFLNELLPKVVFISIKRDPCSNIESVLEARKRQLGDVNSWYSFRIPEMKNLLEIKEPEIQVAGQLYYINKAIDKGLESVAEERKMIMPYEEFCENPEKFYQELRKKLGAQGFRISETYKGESRFDIKRTRTSDNVQEGYRRFMEEYR